MLEPGDFAPDFRLPDESGEERQLSTLLRAGPLILYFYPADFTPGCTKEACDLRDRHEAVLASGLRVFGVSPQSVASHRRFRAHYKLPFHLLADTERQVIRAYGVAGPFGLGVRRVTFTIGGDSRIHDRMHADFLIGRHTRFVQDAIEAQANPRG